MAGRMTREQMVDLINRGESVSHGGRIIRRVEDLPGEAETAETEEELTAVRDDLRGQITELQRRHDEVERKINEVVVEKRATERANRAGSQAAAAARQGNGGQATTNTATVGGQGPEPEFAGHPLSFYRDLTKTAKNDDEAREVLLEQDGVGESTADRILTALRDTKK